MSCFSAFTAKLSLCSFYVLMWLINCCFFLLSFLQPSKWTCRKLWPRPLRPAPRNVWYWATLTAAGCPLPWHSSRVPGATAPLRPPPPSPVQCLLLVSSPALPREEKITWAAWGSLMVATLWVGPSPKRMNWTKGSTGHSSTTPWTDTAAVRRRTPLKSFPWQASPLLSRPPVEAAAPSYMSTSCKRERHLKYSDIGVTLSDVLLPVTLRSVYMCTCGGMYQTTEQFQFSILTRTDLIMTVRFMAKQCGITLTGCKRKKVLTQQARV